MWRMITILAAVGCLTVGCGDDDGGTDTGAADTSPGDTSTGDTGGAMDTGGGTDTGAEDTGGGEDTGAADTGGEDTGGEDTGGDTGGMACEDLAPTESPDYIVISQIHIGESIQFYNPTDAAVNLGELGGNLCNRPSYPTLGDLGGGVTIEAGGYGMIDWPAGFPARDGSGEVGLYTGGPFGGASGEANIRSYVCWSDDGSVMGSNRLSTAEAAGLWTGDCVAIPASGILRRTVGTDGASAGAWEAADAVCE